MAIIRCPECNKDVSDRAKACPHCGFPMNHSVAIHNNISEREEVEESKSRKRRLLIFFAIGSVGLVLILVVVFLVVPRIQEQVRINAFNAEYQEMIAKDFVSSGARIEVSGKYGRSVKVDELSVDELETPPDNLSEKDKIIWERLTKNVFELMCSKMNMDRWGLIVKYSEKDEKIAGKSIDDNFSCEIRTTQNTYLYIEDENGKNSFFVNGVLYEE